jgi:hypothetical protein
MDLSTAGSPKRERASEERRNKGKEEQKSCRATPSSLFGHANPGLSLQQEVVYFNVQIICLTFSLFFHLACVSPLGFWSARCQHYYYWPTTRSYYYCSSSTTK